MIISLDYGVKKCDIDEKVLARNEPLIITLDMHVKYSVETNCSFL